MPEVTAEQPTLCPIDVFDDLLLPAFTPKTPEETPTPSPIAAGLNPTALDAAFKELNQTLFDSNPELFANRLAAEAAEHWADIARQYAEMATRLLNNLDLAPTASIKETTDAILRKITTLANAQEALVNTRNDLLAVTETLNNRSYTLQDNIRGFF